MENQVSLNRETVGGLNELNGLKGPLLGLKLTSSRFLSSLRPKSIFSGGTLAVLGWGRQERGLPGVGN